MNAASPSQVSYLGHVVPITHHFYDVLSRSMMMWPLGYIVSHLYLVLYTCSAQSSVLLCGTLRPLSHLVKPLVFHSNPLRKTHSANLLETL